ncbi:MAG TPA: dipeptide ABC transporter ATP-binding protein [Longimicrobiales bacterium]|nr:dipeptide ABC transporter ATP-binding protein [Longimicrobiales bacterium]
MSAVAGNGERPLLEIEGLRKHYPLRGGILGRKVAEVRAVDGVSLTVRRGETLGLVGESGCGKSTLGRTVMRLEKPTDGRILFEGRDLAHAKGAELFRLRRELQMIFQDPYSSLNPRMTVGEIVREPLVVHRIGTRAEQVERVRALLETVGIGSEALDRYPHEFSGGQRQRIGIARALALDPKLVIADEPVSALDVSVQSQVLNLMIGLQKQRGLTYVFISHDLSVVEHVSDTVAIMYLGRIVERGPTDRIFRRPGMPYTRALLDAIPVPDPRRRKRAAPVQGESPSAVAPPPGCPFHPRCPFAVSRCREVVPELEPFGGPDHLVACIRKEEIADELARPLVAAEPSRPAESSGASGGSGAGTERTPLLPAACV